MRLLRALRIFVQTNYSWSTAWRHARSQQGFAVEAREGFEYIVPRRQQ